MILGLMNDLRLIGGQVGIIVTCSPNEQIAQTEYFAVEVLL